MIYLTKQEENNFLVRLSGPEQDQLEMSILAENLFDTPVKDSYVGKTISFANNKQFKNFLLWREIMSEHSRNNTFSFMRLARPAAKVIRGVLNKDVFSVDSLN